MATTPRRTFGDKETPKKGDASRGRKILMDKLDKSRQANAFARGEGPKTSGGTKAPKGSVAKPQGGRGAGGTRPPGGGNIRPAQKGGLPSVRTTRTEVKTFNKPGGAVTEYKKPGGSVTKYQKPSTAVTEYKKPGMSPAKIEKPSAGGGAVAKGGSYLTEGAKIAGKVGGVYVDMIANAKPLNQGEKEWIADKKNRGPLMKGNSSQSLLMRRENKFAKSGPVATARTMYKGVPRQIAAVKANADDAAKTKRSTSVAAIEAPESSSVGGTKNGPFKSDFAKKSLQGRKPGASPAAAPSKNAGDKLRLNKGSTGKVSNFERMKARQYEKEGYGGRSMTAASAKAQVQKERGYKFKDLFKKR